jgi:hypothetical protein
VLKERSARRDEVKALLAGGDLGNRVPGIVEDLRDRYTGVANAEILNHLMAAYCPAVARLSGLGDAEKRGRMQRAGNQFRAVIYSGLGSKPASESASPRHDG